ncbi:MAG: hypothetical protein KIG32_07535 [Ruminiclostridium sp.]|nr:hypothetical protein [Ruminiclostridium sp.]
MRDKLKNYRAICAELDDVTAELDGLSATDAVQSAATPPYSKHSVPVSGLPPTDRVKTLLARQAALRAFKSEVDRFISQVPYYLVKKAIKLYYIVPIDEGEDRSNTNVWNHKPSWEDVTDIIGNGENAEALKKRVYRYLKDSEK